MISRPLKYVTETLQGKLGIEDNAYRRDVPGTSKYVQYYQVGFQTDTSLILNE